MSTPENDPQNPQTPPVNPTPPQYGQVAPEGQNPPVNPPAANPYGQPPSHNPYGQAPNAPYGQPPQAPPAYGQQPYGQQPYGGGFPVPPQGNFAPPKMPTERPKELNYSFWAIIAAGVLTLVGTLLVSDAVIRAQISVMPDIDQLMTEAGISLDSFIAMTKTMTMIMGVISLGIYVLIAFMVRKGSNVARIFATVFAALSLISLVSASGILSILAVLLGVAGVVFAWLRPSSNYIAARRAARAAGYR